MDYQEGLQYSEEVRNAVRYGYEYRKEAEALDDQFVYYRLGDSPEVLLWLANLIIGGVVWDVFKLTAKNLYDRIVRNKGSLGNDVLHIFSDEKCLKEFYNDIKEFNEQRMSVTEKQFMYIREEIIAEYFSNECVKIYENEGRMPTQEEYKDMYREAIKHADRLLNYK